MPSPSRGHRRKAAAERQKVYDSLTVEEKLARLDQRPGESKRERARLGKTAK